MAVHLMEAEGRCGRVFRARDRPKTKKAVGIWVCTRFHSDRPLSKPQTISFPSDKRYSEALFKCTTVFSVPTVRLPYICLFWGSSLKPQSLDRISLERCHRLFEYCEGVAYADITVTIFFVPSLSGFVDYTRAPVVSSLGLRMTPPFLSSVATLTTASGETSVDALCSQYHSTSSLRSLTTPSNDR
jgi:hypothetical protein